MQRTNAESTPIQKAVARRTALATAGCSTYVLGQHEEFPAILCLCCGLWTFHPEDVANRYCGFCHAFHTEWTKKEV